MGQDELLAALSRDLADLARYAAEVDYDSFIRDRDTQNMVLFGVYRVIQDMLDLADAVIVERGLGVPASYKDSIRILGQSQMLDPALVRHLEDWAGLRNVITHIYRKLDLDTIFAAVTGEREPLEAFLARMQEDLLTS